MKELGATTGSGPALLENLMLHPRSAGHIEPPSDRDVEDFVSKAAELVRVMRRLAVLIASARENPTCD
jgi:hypothetical protein